MCLFSFVCCYALLCPISFSPEVTHVYGSLTLLPVFQKSELCKADLTVTSTMCTQCMVSEILNLCPHLLKSIVHVIRFITNRKYAFCCIY